MYKFNMILSKIAKATVSATLIICLPLSIILLVGSVLMWNLESFIVLILGPEAWTNVLNAIQPTGIEIIKWIGVGLTALIVLIFVILITSKLISNSLYKNINGVKIARNREIRNIDINKAINKLERYRYRE